MKHGDCPAECAVWISYQCGLLTQGSVPCCHNMNVSQLDTTAESPTLQKVEHTTHSNKVLVFR